MAQEIPRPFALQLLHNSFIQTRFGCVDLDGVGLAELPDAAAEVC